PADPFSAVLVLNVGAVRGRACPADHWLYNCGTKSGFHRVGFYSNVDESFLPRRGRRDRVSIYVERAYLPGARPAAGEGAAYAREAGAELQDWGFIGEPEVVDPTWIEVAYTWLWPRSPSRGQARAAREAHPVHTLAA